MNQRLVNILKFPRRRYHPPHGNLLYLPLREMSIGTSPNLLSNAGFEAGTTGWSSSASAVLASETTNVYSGSKALKVTCGAGGNTWCGAVQSITSTPYRGITMTAKAYGKKDAGNTLNAIKLITYSNTGSWVQAAVGAVLGTTYTLSTLTYKIETNSTQYQVKLHANASGTADADDIGYWDDVSLTVPQSLSRDSFSRICHPEGCIWTPNGFSFDGTDDLITFETDFIGTSACTIMGWIKPTGWGGNNQGNIICNQKFVVAVENAGGQEALAVTSNYLTVAISANSSITLNQSQHVAVTRTAAGTANFYVNGVLSGAADQASGSPAGGTTNIVVGNRLAGDRGFAGTIDDLLVFNRVLSIQEIQAHYTATKGWH